MPKPVEIGVMFRREQDPATLTSYARRVERMGLDQLWVVEDCFYMGGISQAAIALTATETLHVGIGINPGVAHNPAILAMEYATLARAFPGRLIGGIGHGVAEWMGQIGARPQSSLRSIEEFTAAFRRLLRGERVTVAGDYVELRDVQLFEAPQEVPPVLLGVRSEKSLRLAGTCADGLLLAENSAPDYVRWASSLMNDARKRAGIAGEGDVVVYANCLVNDVAPGQARARMREIVAKENGHGLSPSVRPLAFAAEMRNLIDKGGTDALREEMPDTWLHDLSLTGSYEDARSTVRRLRAAGAGGVVLVPPASVDPNAWLDDQRWAATIQ